MQSSRFHERKQTQTESVDSYAQDLRKLFRHTYSSARSDEGTETMAQSVLACQFVAGLRDELKSKLVGREGNFEQLLVLSVLRKLVSKKLLILQGQVDAVLHHHHRTRRPHQILPTRQHRGHVLIVGALDSLPGNVDCEAEEYHVNPEGRRWWCGGGGV